MAVPILKTENLCFKYSSGFSLNSINVELYEGEKVVVLGSNGSGKSTFFLNINGVLSHDSGNVYFEDTLITRKNLNVLRRGVGIVFQDPDSQLISSTVESEVAFGALNLGLPEDEAMQRTDDALTKMRISHLRDRPVHYLSGGQKKSVTIADILVMQPKVIIFDEPTASLDPVSCTMFESVLTSISESNVTTLISTHDVDFAWRWADRVLVFNGGELIADATPDSVFNDDTLLKRSNLQRPTLLEVSHILSDSGVIPKGSSVKSVEELRSAIAKG
jgi:cobalt/nickel transport system ATP-binding protein